MNNETASPNKMTIEPQNEASLQRQIVNLLRLKGIEPLWHRTDKRSTGTVGWPDISFATKARVHYGLKACGNEETFKTVALPCLWEVKIPKGKLSPEQEWLRIKLEANGWRYRVIRSLDEAIQELKEMGA